MGSRRRSITFQLASPPDRGAVLWVFGLSVVGTDGVMLHVRGNYSIPTNRLFWSPRGVVSRVLSYPKHQSMERRGRSLQCHEITKGVLEHGPWWRPYTIRRQVRITVVALRWIPG